MRHRSVAVLSVLVLAAWAFVWSATPSGAHGVQLPLAVNATFTSNYPAAGGCDFTYGHGNVFNFAYSKTKIATSSNGCTLVYMDVTGCSGLNCPTASKTGSAENVWYQAQVEWVSIVHSHGLRQYLGGNSATYHYCIPGIGC